MGLTCSDNADGVILTWQPSLGLGGLTKCGMGGTPYWTPPTLPKRLVGSTGAVMPCDYSENLLLLSTQPP